MKANELLKLHRLSSQLLQKVVGDDRKGNVLVICHGGLAPPECPRLMRDERRFGLALCLRTGARQPALEPEYSLDCASNALPFQDEVFRAVILFQVIQDGTEQELDEACRVLNRGGELLLIGLNRSSWSGVRTCRGATVPALRLAKVRAGLEARDMVIDRMLGAGLMGLFARPCMESKTFSAAALPFADVLLLRARHRERPQPTRMRLKEFRAGAVPTSLSSV